MWTLIVRPYKLSQLIARVITTLQVYLVHILTFHFGYAMSHLHAKLTNLWTTSLTNGISKIVTKLYISVKKHNMSKQVNSV